MLITKKAVEEFLTVPQSIESLKQAFQCITERHLARLFQVLDTLERGKRIVKIWMPTPFAREFGSELARNWLISEEEEVYLALTITMQNQIQVKNTEK